MQKIICHHRTNCMAAHIFRPGVTTAITEKPCHRADRTGDQRTAKHIFLAATAKTFAVHKVFCLLCFFSAGPQPSSRVISVSIASSNLVMNSPRDKPPARLGRKQTEIRPGFLINPLRAQNRPEFNATGTTSNPVA